MSELLLLRRLSVWYSPDTTLPMIKSMGQLLARAWMLAIHVQELGISHHR